MLAGLPEVLPFLSAVAPLAVMNFMGTLQCVESAAAAGDRFPPFPTMIVNGVATMVGRAAGLVLPDHRLHRPPRLEGARARARATRS